MSEGKTKVLIAEDDFVVAKNLSITLEERGYEILGISESGEELLQSLSKQPTDIVIMDINLAGLMDGIEVTSLIKSKTNTPVLYLTSDRDHATLERAKLTNPDGYLIKPFDDDELVSAIEIALHRHHLAAGNQKEDTVVSESHLFVKVKNRLEKLKFEDIRYIEANDIYSILMTSQNSYILSYSLKTLEEKLPASRFMRVHRSYIVNVEHIQAIEDNYIQIADKSIPIGKTYREDLMKRLSII
ncbi:response regulator [Ekhidna sp.]|jgi:DNA-binding LytR/AlgR family response regulator|uniref:LytR/AlgR family response regulator transcription factor n=1 Tax=Ekhidna sp. TaxID=2608089 RepID=UPI0032EE10CA